MTLKVAINGFSRIGRSVLCALSESGKYHHINVVAVSKLTEPETIVNLRQHDVNHECFCKPLLFKQAHLFIANEENDRHDQIHSLHQIDGLARIYAGAKKVLFSHPTRKNTDFTVINQVNQYHLIFQHQIAFNRFYTVHFIVPIIKRLDNIFCVKTNSIKNNVMTRLRLAMNKSAYSNAYCLLAVN